MTEIKSFDPSNDSIPNSDPEYLAVKINLSGADAQLDGAGGGSRRY